MFQWRGLLFLIDVGMSEGVGTSQGAVLRIRARSDEGGGQEAIAICADGERTSIWDRSHNPKTGRAICIQN
jgi:hypothetical protein